MYRGFCVMCGRPLPSRRWWHFLSAPTTCRPDANNDCWAALMNDLYAHREDPL